MLDRLLRRLGSTALSLFLLMVGSALMLVGSIYAGADKSLIAGLNETRLQDWLLAHLDQSFSQLWWMLPLLAVLLLLGLNGAACAFLRLRGLIAARRGVPARAFFTALCPTLVHVGFLVVMLGHGITFTMGDWQRADLGEPGPLRQAPVSLTLESVEREHVEEDSAVARQASQTEISLRDEQGRLHAVRYMRPATVGSYDILLDETRAKDGSATLQLFFVCDPGIVLIVPAFLLILLLMTWYFVEIARASRR